MASPPRRHHFLIVTDPMLSHVNSARRLAARVAAAMPNARVTFSTAVSGHRVMFPHLKFPDGEVLQGLVSYVPYSDGFDGGFNPEAHGADAYCPRARAVGSETLSAVVARLAGRGRPVTRVVYTALVGWVPDVARAHGVPAALYWAKPATAFAVYHHYFHGHAAELLAACTSDPGLDAAVLLPGLPPLKRDALPSFASMVSPGKRHYLTLGMLRDLFSALDEHGSMVLVDTFDALEPDALRAVPQLDLVAVGPVTAEEPRRRGVELLLPCDAKACMEWLDTKPPRSVVYASFGSILSVSKRQEEEMRRGLDATGRPYLWVARRTTNGAGGERGMVVEWCDQRRVLSHPAVGCFVTHCRWDSTLESLAGGVPMVAVPRWADQTTVAALVEEYAGVGVRARVDGEGVVSRGELQSCLEVVMGGAAAIRERAERWAHLAKAAVSPGGTSERRLRAFASEA
ncbi:UDP-glycosyltransferase 75C1-like [Oryza brachyantha]|uniref:UDP-glycosyltransferase 75C1-like n=1 Tax=Oryza brachyantha TaxID=4533 RepID=UPI001ADA589A|nr:UDP-glycosyltransferase 75C1-like [Oryza brachyantha]